MMDLGSAALYGVACCGLVVAYKFCCLVSVFVDIKTKPIGQPAYARKRLPASEQTAPEPRVIIIGAGPAGVAAAGTLNHLGIENIVIEKTNDVCSSWKGHYKRLHLHSIMQFSHLPYLPFPKHYPLYVSRQQFADYVTGYASIMQVKINFGEAVTTVVEPSGATKKWKVETVKKDGTKVTYQAESVIVCTGMTSSPNIPTFPDQHLFKGPVLHSSKYFTADTLRGKKVLVVGFGNTAGELTMDLHEHDCDPHVIVRSPVNIVHRKRTLLAPTIGRHIPIWLRLCIEWCVVRQDYGDLHKFGIQCPISSGFKDLPYYRLRILHQAPVVDIGFVDLIRKGIVKVHTQEIDRFTATGVVFKDGKEETFDAVILATGFDSHLKTLLPSNVYNSAINKHGFPMPMEVLEKEHPGLYFVGFEDKVGRIWSITEDSLDIAKSIKQFLKKF